MYMHELMFVIQKNRAKLNGNMIFLDIFLRFGFVDVKNLTLNSLWKGACHENHPPVNYDGKF